MEMFVIERRRLKEEKQRGGAAQLLALLANAEKNENFVNRF